MKSNPELTETITSVRNNVKWIDIARILAAPSRRRIRKNLFEIDKATTAGDTVLIPGKVLSVGDLTKKIRIVALSFSESVKDKAKKTKTELVTILEEIKKNPKREGIKILR